MENTNRVLVDRRVESPCSNLIRCPEVRDVSFDQPFDKECLLEGEVLELVEAATCK